MTKEAQRETDVTLHLVQNGTKNVALIASLLNDKAHFKTHKYCSWVVHTEHAMVMKSSINKMNRRHNDSAH